MAKGLLRGLGLTVSVRLFATLIFLTALVMSPAVTAQAFAPGTTAIVATDALNVRSEPGTGNTILRVLHQGDAVTISGEPVTANEHRWVPINPSGWVVDEFLRTEAGASAPKLTSATFAAGDQVLVDAGALNFRVEAGTASRVIRPLAYGTVLTITGGPVNANGYTWYQAKTTAATGATSGWAIGQALLPAPVEMPDPGVMFDNGSAVHVDTDVLRLRSDPGTSSSTITLLPNGTILTITGGPVGADGHTWYPVATASGTEGWVVEEYLAFGAGGNAAQIKPGSPALVEDGPLNFRDGPGFRASIQAELATGTWLMVVSGPREADGYHWYEVDTSTGRSGWVIGEALIPEK
jgi:rare lipoprotein A